jgi:hypothetical protein
VDIDLSVRRVLEALTPGPAAVRILVTSYGMEVAESEEALAWCVDEGLCEQVGALGFGLTDYGKELSNMLSAGRHNAMTAEDIKIEGTRAEMRQLHAEGDRHATKPVHKAGALRYRHANVTNRPAR